MPALHTKAPNGLVRGFGNARKAMHGFYRAAEPGESFVKYSYFRNTKQMGSFKAMLLLRKVIFPVLGSTLYTTRSLVF
jgi:hypothetical protein